MPEADFFVIAVTALNYATLMLFGYFREFFRYFFPTSASSPPKGYAPMVKDFEDFYIRRLYGRICDCWNRPIVSSPGAWMDVVDRVLDQANKVVRPTGKNVRCLNLGSYNYLGFADVKPMEEDLMQAIENYGVASCSSAMEMGSTKLHAELERLAARYVGHEDAMVFGMGFATNSTVIPALMGKQDLIISDSLNHASIVWGARASGAKIKVFRHGDINHLEEIVRESIAYGQPRTRRPWKRVMIIVEGIYSMEGEIVRLDKLVELKKKYKCYLYVDEAHSIGAIGKTGRGVVEYWNVNPKDIDVMMGTFTKSFGAVGGYIAGSSKLIQYLRPLSWGNLYATTLAPVCCQQIISALKIIIGEDGTSLGKQKLNQLRENSNYFRRELIKRGFLVYGNDDSPVVPVMLFNPAKMPAFSREALKRKLAVVVVGFPATTLIDSRVRFCLSSAHTREDLEYAVKMIDEIGDLVLVKYNNNAPKAITSN
eukprot:gb/GECH01011630.1/.p1 GENE.gb/GECH01011630.1/~~gb/GECH01011630.1/.p1  ORF type:complete len:482 (+),score=86.21 gb/GECH01011630.1/:1-1446(+)